MEIVLYGADIQIPLANNSAGHWYIESLVLLKPGDEGQVL